MDRLVEYVVRTTNPDALNAMTDQPAVFLDAPDAAMHLFLADLRAEYGSTGGLRGVGRRRSRRRSRRCASNLLI